MLPLVGDRLAFRPSSGVPVLCFGELEGQTAFVHGIFTRQGGVSRPPYDSLNVSLSVGDDPDHVAENRRRRRRHRPDNLRPVRCRQVSGTAVAVVSDPPPSGPWRPMRWSRSAGLVLWMTADCLPIISRTPVLHLPVHAGWRGTVGAIAVSVEGYAGLGLRPSPRRPIWGRRSAKLLRSARTSPALQTGTGRRAEPGRTGGAALSTCQGSTPALEAQGVRAVHSGVCLPAGRICFQPSR